MESAMLAVLSLGITFAIAAFLGKLALTGLPVILCTASIASIVRLQRRKKLALKTATGDFTELYAAHAMEAAMCGVLAVGLFTSLYTLSVLFGGDTNVPKHLMYALVTPVALLLCAYPTIASGGWRAIATRSHAFLSAHPQAMSAKYAWRGMWLTITEISCVNFVFLAGVFLAGITMH
jgi:hypothetical protein